MHLFGSDILFRKMFPQTFYRLAVNNTITHFNNKYATKRRRETGRAQAEIFSVLLNV